MNVLIVGRLLDTVDDTRTRVRAERAVLYGATTLDEVRIVLALQRIDLLVIGAGIELSERLAIARTALEQSETITVHLKDKASGQAGFVSFVERVIACRQMVI